MRNLPVIANLTGSLWQRGVRNTSADLQSIVLKPLMARSLPRHLQIEIITRCNLACTMCPRTVALKRARSQEEVNPWYRQMPFERFKEIINQFHALQSLSLHGIGEPLMHPQLFEMVEASAARGIKVRFTTNATLLDQAKSERLIMSRLHQLIISMDGATAETYEAIRQGAHFEYVVENIRALSSAKRAMKSATPLIYLNMVVCRSNHHEAAQLVDLAHTIGAECVVLSPIQPPAAEIAHMVCDSESWNRAVAAAKRRARKWGIVLYARRKERSSHHRSPKKTYQCLNPWLSAVVLMNGDVMPCCNIHDADFSMGNLFDESFPKVWNGPAYQSFRSELRQKGHVPKPCRWCPDF